MSTESIYISIPITGHDDAAERTKAGQISTMSYEMGCDTVINPFDVCEALKVSYKREPTYEEIMQAVHSGMISFGMTLNDYYFIENGNKSL